MDNDGIMDISGKEVFYSYNSAGDYLVIMTVTDTGGLTDTATTMIYVNQGQGNNGKETVYIELRNGGNGSMIPNSQVHESKLDYNWNITEDDMEGLENVEVKLIWADTSWDLDLFFGVGLNPENGMLYGEDSGGSEGNGEGEVILNTDSPGELSYSGVDQWFLRVITKERTVTNGGSKLLAESCSFQVSVTLTYS